MAKLLLAVVHQADSEPVADALRAGHYRFTRIPTVGGFLGESNATFALAVEDDAVEDVLGVFEAAAHSREVEVPLVLLDRLRDWQDATVSHAGATVLIADLERIVRV
jgi:uncharacterized protein YaaQ